MELDGGKIFGLVLSAIVIFALKLSLDAVGFRKQEHSKITWLAVGLFIV
jgi:hypothetical protein